MPCSILLPIIVYYNVTFHFFVTSTMEDYFDEMEDLLPGEGRFHRDKPLFWIKKAKKRFRFLL